MHEKRVVGQRGNLEFGLLEIVNKYQIACLVKNFLDRIRNHVGYPKHVWYKLPKLAQKPWALSPKRSLGPLRNTLHDLSFPVDGHASSSELSLILFFNASKP